MRRRAEPVCAARKTSSRAGRPDQQQITTTVQEFLAWHQERYGAPDEEFVQTLAYEWLSTDHFALRHMCSPHRIALTFTLIREMYFPEDSEPTLALLPAWVKWCIERSELRPDLAERALTAARASKGLPEDRPFRTPE